MTRKLLLLLVTVSCLFDDIDGNANNTDPCDFYNVLLSDNRQHTLRENNGICDNSLPLGWYQLEIDGRPAEIPKVCLQNNVCGTQLPLRIDLGGNPMPTPGNVLDAYACTSYDVLGQWDCCVLREPVQIKNCGNFYIYHLRPTDRCPVAYCAQEIGVNPSPDVTRKRGDQSRATTAGDMSTTTSSNDAEHTTSVTNSSADADQNMAGNITTESTLTNATSETAAESVTTSSTDVASTPTSDNASSPRNASEVFTTTVGGTVSTTEDSNVTMTTVMPETTQNTSANLECKNWARTPCHDGITTCYLSPVDNQHHIACAEDSGCGALCDSVPDCPDGSDESKELCPSTIMCVEAQELCSDGSACFTRCDGHTSCNNTKAGEDEDGCATVSSSTANTTVTNTNSTTNITTPPDGFSSEMTQPTTIAPASTEGQPEDETTTQLSAATTQTSVPDLENTTISTNVSVTTHSLATGSETTTSVATDGETTTSVATDGETTTSVVAGSETTTSLATDRETIISVAEGGETTTSLAADGETTTSLAEDGETTASLAADGETTTSLAADGETTASSVTTGSDVETVTVSHSTLSGLTRSVSIQDTSASATSSSGSTHDDTASVVATTQSESISTQSDIESSTKLLTTRSSTNDSRLTSTPSESESADSSTVSASPSEDYTSVGEETTVQTLTTESVPEISSLPTRALTTETPESISEESSRTRIGIAEVTTETTSSSSSVTTVRLQSSSEDVQTQPITEIIPAVTTTGSVDTSRTPTTESAVSDVSTTLGTTGSVQESMSASTATLPASPSSTARTLVLTTEESVRTSEVPVSLSTAIDAETTKESTTEAVGSVSDVTSTDHTIKAVTDGDASTATHDVHVTSTESEGSTIAGTQNTSAEISSVTGPKPTESVDNQTDHTVHVIKEKKGLYYENFGLFVFLIVAAVVIFGICMFGIVGYTYQRRLRTWNPTMAYQDAYGDMEKTTLSFGRDKHGVESPIPDFDILRDEKKIEEISLSQASTVALGATPGRQEAPFDDTYDDAISSDKMTNGKPTTEATQQDNEVSYITNGQLNEGFVADDNVDGIVPVDEIDISPPRALFPWIENAADTKL